jgi:hypothetical protein
MFIGSFHESHCRLRRAYSFETLLSLVGRSILAYVSLSHWQASIVLRVFVCVLVVCPRWQFFLQRKTFIENVRVGQMYKISWQGVERCC